MRDKKYVLLVKCEKPAQIKEDVDFTATASIDSSDKACTDGFISDDTHGYDSADPVQISTMDDTISIS